MLVKFNHLDSKQSHHIEFTLPRPLIESDIRRKFSSWNFEYKTPYFSDKLLLMSSGAVNYVLNIKTGYVVVEAETKEMVDLSIRCVYPLLYSCLSLDGTAVFLSEIELKRKRWPTHQIRLDLELHDHYLEWERHCYFFEVFPLILEEIAKEPQKFTVFLRIDTTTLPIVAPILESFPCNLYCLDIAGNESQVDDLYRILGNAKLQPEYMGLKGFPSVAYLPLLPQFKHMFMLHQLAIRPSTPVTEDDALLWIQTLPRCHKLTRFYCHGNPFPDSTREEMLRAVKRWLDVDVVDAYKPDLVEFRRNGLYKGKEQQDKALRALFILLHGMTTPSCVVSSMSIDLIRMLSCFLLLQ